MSEAVPGFARLAQLLPEAAVGTVRAIEPIALGLSGADVYAVSSSRGELVLRVSATASDPVRWKQQLDVLRRVAAAGVAPAILHVDEQARAVVAARVDGMP